jgi:hypothetical protein
MSWPGIPDAPINLHGIDAFDAAVHCAALCAGEEERAGRRKSPADLHARRVLVTPSQEHDQQWRGDASSQPRGRPGDPMPQPSAVPGPGLFPRQGQRAAEAPAATQPGGLEDGFEQPVPDIHCDGGLSRRFVDAMCGHILPPSFARIHWMSNAS